MRQNKDNKTSNVHQTNKKVQGHDKQNQIKIPARGETRPFDVQWCPYACVHREPENSQKAPIILQEDRGKKMQEVTMANENT
jgi:hypothetical protein